MTKISTKMYIFLILIIFAFTISINAQTEKEPKKTSKSLFPLDDPISDFLLKVFFLPIEMLTPETEPRVTPELTKEQEMSYNMKKIPLTLKQDILLLVNKETDRVESFWAQKDQEWVKPDNKVRQYLQERYENRDVLWEEAKKHRILKGMQDRMDELHDLRLGIKGETKPVQ